MARDARRDPSQPDEEELLPAGMKRRPTLPFGMPAVRAGTANKSGTASTPKESTARARPAPLRPNTRPPPVYEDMPLRRETPIAKRIGGFALEPEDEQFLDELAHDLRPHLAWLLGDRRQEFHRELSEGHLDVALDMLLEDRRANPRNVSASKAAHALRDAIREHVRTRIGPMDAVPFLLRQPEVSARSHVRVLPLINGVSTIEDIIGSCQLPVLETIRALARLQATGSIDVPGGPAPRTPTHRDPTPKPRIPTPKPRIAASLNEAPKPRPAARATSPLPFRAPSPTTDDKSPVSSRLTIPEILVPFAEDLDALGVGDGGGLRSASGVHPVTPSRNERGPIADPTTPIPDGSEASTDEAEEEPETAAEEHVARSVDTPHEPIEVEPPRPSVPSLPEADPALDELGAIWRKRSNRKAEIEAALAEPPATPGSTGAARSDVTEAAPSDRASEPHFPSIPALDPLPVADERAHEPAADAAPTSTRSREVDAQTRARNIRFSAIVAVVAGLVIVAMFTLRALRSTAPAPSDAATPSAPAPSYGASPAPLPPADAPPVDTAPSFIDRGTVTFTIKVTPKYARVFLDDVLLVPVTEVKLRREDKDHVLRAEAPGFATRELTVSSRSDASLVIALNQAPGTVAPAPPPAKAPGKPAPAKTGAPAAEKSEKPAEAPAQPYPD